MARVSNFLIATLNILSLVISIMAITGAVYIQLHESSECQRVLRTPLLLVGLCLFVVSLLGLIGSACKVSWVMWIYVTLMLLLIVGLFCFTVFTIVVTNRGVGKWVAGRGFMEYRFGDYSHWLQKYVVNDGNWDNIRNCLVDARVCRTIQVGNATEFYHQLLTPIQSGCCKPPSYCKFHYVNATFWEVPKSGPAVTDGDCKAWSNNQKELCYNCNSCKGGVLANIKSQWRKLAIFIVFIIILLITVYSLGCYALKGNRSDHKYLRYQAHP